MSSAIWHDSFYRFARLERPDELVESLTRVCEAAGLMGSISVAEEGINGMVAGREDGLERLRACFEADPRFAGMSVKRTPCQDLPFKRLKVRRKAELVPLGVAGVQSREGAGVTLSPLEWRELLGQEGVLLIDNRNSFEYELGHFRRAVNPQVENFRDFAAYVRRQCETWQGRRVAIYCTGGIRCEKTAAWLEQEGLTVYQLQGGILNYFAALPDAEREFGGACFVFDERVALDTRLRPVEPAGDEA